MARLHLPTVAAVAVLAYAGANLTHELIGHCGAAWLVGGGCGFVSTADIRLDPDTTPLDRFAFLAAAGTAANLAAAAIAWLALRRSREAAGPLRLFLWLTMAVNLLVASGYAALSPLIFFGDWHNILVTAEAGWPWRAFISACGILVWWWSWRVCKAELERMVGAGPRPLVRALLWTCYAAGSGAMAGAALFSPLELRWALLVGLGSAAGLTAPLLLMRLPRSAGDSAGTGGFVLVPSPGWLVAGAAAALLLIPLGRGFAT